jgi:hypothetical protein
MRPLYEPFVNRRFCEGRIFFVNHNMPFEFFLDCFQQEQPFFIIAQLEDGRIAITPNPLVMPMNLLRAGYGPRDLLPTDYEYVTLKNATFPVIITAHPVPNAQEWMIKFERWVHAFAQQTLAQFVACSVDRIPIKFEIPPAKKALAPEMVPTEV